MGYLKFKEMDLHFSQEKLKPHVFPFSIHNINKTTPPNITITENSRELVQLNYQSGTINWLSASVPARISMQPPSSM